jgi:hypothetical protein
MPDILIILVTTQPLQKKNAFVKGKTASAMVRSRA